MGPTDGVVGTHSPYCSYEVAAVHGLSSTSPGVHLMHVPLAGEGPLLMLHGQHRLYRKWNICIIQD